MKNTTSYKKTMVIGAITLIGTLSVNAQGTNELPAPGQVWVAVNTEMLNMQAGSAEKLQVRETDELYTVEAHRDGSGRGQATEAETLSVLTRSDLVASACDLCGKDSKTQQLHSAMQTLWADHMIWTYATVDAFYHNPTAFQPTLDRLLQNQKDIGAAIVPYYGQAAGDRLTALLTTHINQAVPVLKAAKENDKAGLDKALADWYANAKEIATFLTAANPKNWPASATEPMMKTHIDQTTGYAVALLKNEYANAVKLFDEARQHMGEMGIVLASGIIEHYPDKFKEVVKK